MTFDEQKLYELLPVIYRIRDAELSTRQHQSSEYQAKLAALNDQLAGLADQNSNDARALRKQIERMEGGPLRSLLAVIAEQAGALERNLEQLYDDQFVETCAPWVLPYLGDLIGIKGLPSSGLEALNPRAEVGHTIGYRRRKGTAAMLEQLARDVTGWPARAVEFFQLLATTQFLNHLRPENESFVSLRNAERLEYLGSAFEHAPAEGPDLTHTVDVRRIARARGRYNIPNVGIFLWRLRAFPLTRSPAVPAAGGGRRFFFNPLGCDLPLFNLPQTEDEITHLAEPANVSDRIGRRVLKRKFSEFYGPGKSLVLELENPDLEVEPAEIPPELIVVCDLTGWKNMPVEKIAIDPVLGRIALPSAPASEMPDLARKLLVTFHYGFSANMGGGEYNRAGSSGTEVLDEHGQPIVERVNNSYRKDDVALDSAPSLTIAAALTLLDGHGGTVEILNSGRYEESLTVDATGRQRIVIRAADERRPLVKLSGDLLISGGKDDEVILDGLLIEGGRIKVSGLGRLSLRHCTLVPGISLDADGTPAQPGGPSLVIQSANTSVEIDHSIVGAIRSNVDAEVNVRDSIIDATGETGFAYGGPLDFGAPLTITNSTVIGQARTRILKLASNTIFLASFADEADQATLIAPVLAERRQEGCARFSYLSRGARVPVRYHCQPEPDDSLVRPRFVSTHFNDPGYCQLSATGPCEIRRGADDEASMGAFHDLYEPQRESHLRARLEEYLRFGLEAGIFYAT